MLIDKVLQTPNADIENANITLTSSLRFYSPIHQPKREFRYELAFLRNGITTKRRKDASMKRTPFGGRQFHEIYLPRDCVEIETPIYRKTFEFPFRCNESPAIDRITWRGKEIFFGVINDKLAIYSIFNSNGKRQMHLYGIENLAKEQKEDKRYLRMRVNFALNNLLELYRKKNNSLGSYLEGNFFQAA
jgi:hypothetical protein